MTKMQKQKLESLEKMNRFMKPYIDMADAAQTLCKDLFKDIILNTKIGIIRFNFYSNYMYIYGMRIYI